MKTCAYYLVEMFFFDNPQKAGSMRDAYRDEIFKQYVENLQSYIKVQRTQSVDVWTIKYVLLDAPLLVDEGK